MRAKNGSIPIPWPNRIRHLLANQLQQSLFVLSIVAVLVLWFRQSPRVVVMGQVERLEVVVTASRDGVLEVTDQPLARFDRVVQGITPVARISVTEALLKMQTLTAQRQQLQAELDAQRVQIQREQMRQHRQLQQQVIDRNRQQIATGQRVDQLTTDVSDLQQRQRALAIKHQENRAVISRAEIEIKLLGENRARIQRRIDQRMSPPSQLSEIDSQLVLQTETLRSGQELNQLINLQIRLVDKQSIAAQQRLAHAVERSAASKLGWETQNEVDGADPQEDLDGQALIQPFIEAVVVHDAKIRILAHQIANNQIVSPASGTISKIHHPPGTFVQSGDPIITIASDQRRWIVAYLDSDDQAKIGPDAEVEIRISGLPSTVPHSSVAETGNHFESVPVELRRNSAVAQWGIPIKIPIPVGVDVVPGQTVQLVIQ